jgi:hypothetical protein
MTSITLATPSGLLEVGLAHDQQRIPSTSKMFRLALELLLGLPFPRNKLQSRQFLCGEERLPVRVARPFHGHPISTTSCPPPAHERWKVPSATIVFKVVFDQSR